jgi:hypothetical protein
MTIFRNFIISLILLIGIPAAAQDFIIGVKYGYGNVNYIRQSDDRELTKSPQNRIAVVMEFSPFLAGMYFISGVEYISNEYTSSLSVPLTIRISVGTKLRPFIEGGGYYNFCLTDKPDDFIVKNDLGAKTGAGLLLIPNKRLRIDAGYYWRFGLTTGLGEEILLPLGQIQYEEYQLREGNLEISLKYRF